MPKKKTPTPTPASTQTPAPAPAPDPTPAPVTPPPSAPPEREEEEAEPCRREGVRVGITATVLLSIIFMLCMGMVYLLTKKSSTEKAGATAFPSTSEVAKATEEATTAVKKQLEEKEAELQKVREDLRQKEIDEVKAEAAREVAEAKAKVAEKRAAEKEKEVAAKAVPVNKNALREYTVDESEGLEDLVIRWDTVGKHRFPIMKNPSGRPTPFHPDFAAPVPLDERGDWQVADYRLPDGRTVKGWALAVK